MLIPPDTKQSPPTIDDDAPPPDFEGNAFSESDCIGFPPEKAMSEVNDEDEDSSAAPEASTSSLSTEDTEIIAGPALSFHIYKVPGWFKWDVVVKSEDKSTVKYYLSDPRQFMSTKWDMTLRRDSETGPAVATMQKSGLLSRCFQVKMLDEGFSTSLYTDYVGKVHHFVGKDGRKMKWTNAARALTGAWVCRIEDTEELVARWRRTLFAKLKEGQLMIVPTYIDQTDLLLATALATEGWARRERNRRGG